MPKSVRLSHEWNRCPTHYISRRWSVAIRNWPRDKALSNKKPVFPCIIRITLLLDRIILIMGIPIFWDYKDNSAIGQLCPYNGNSYTCKTASLYRNTAGMLRRSLLIPSEETLFAHAWRLVTIGISLASIRDYSTGAKAPQHACV